MAAIRGADRVGIRICPGNPFNDLHDDDPEETFTKLIDAVDTMGLAYLHVIRLPKGSIVNIELAKKYFSGVRIFNDSYDSSEAVKTIINCPSA